MSVAMCQLSEYKSEGYYQTVALAWKRLGVKTTKIKAHIATCKLNYTMMDCEGRLFSHRHAQIGAMQIFQFMI